MTGVPDPELDAVLEIAFRSLVDAAPALGLGVGIGVDVEDHDRWRDSGLRVAALFTPAELTWCRARADLPAQLAGTWCAKEATVKAVAGHLRLSLRDVEVVRDEWGRPGVRLLPSGLHDHGRHVRVSISRTRDVSLAVALYLPATDAG
jgi:phosphopantetheine--protein transferase-like protein